MTKKNSVAVFEDATIRKIWHENEWWFSVVDVVAALTNSSDSRNYWKVLKHRLNEEKSEVVTKCNQLKLQAQDGKFYLTDCSNTEGLFRIIQSIPSPKAEPFKLWLAKVGYERIQEIENPELAQNRARSYYEQKGYPNEWIEMRIRGISIRQDLTKEWTEREVQERDFGLLTNEISKATFGKTVGEYKEFKGLKKENLRDHMTDWELILTMFGEKATTDITKEKNSKGFEECKESATLGGNIDKRAREDLEKNLGKNVISNEKFLPKKKELG